MQPIHDVDVLLLLATALAAKRRPAEALDIVAAIDLIQNNVPGEEKLSEAFARLGACGLLYPSGDGVVLSAAAQTLIEALPRKAEAAERLFSLRNELAAWTPSAGEHASIDMPAAGLKAAILAHRAAAQTGAKNLLVPKPPAAETAKRPGQRQRKPLPARRRKD